MKGVSEHHRREVGVNLTAGRVNAVEICQKILNAPSLDDLLERFQREHNLPSVPLDQRYSVITEPAMGRREEPEPMDDTVLDDAD